ncbi:MAG: peptidylprolyl isomerase [bacterium]|nr:peptidylprolyl isomerase [bacterium]
MFRLTVTILAFATIFVGAAIAEETDTVLSDTAKELPAGTRIVVMETEKGTMEIQLFDEDTPITAENFAKLVADGFYDGMPFHRVVDDFVVQAGDPSLVGIENMSLTLEVEPDQHECVRGRISMARGWDGVNYLDTSPTQFFIMINDASRLDPDFCFFGEVVTGIKTVDQLKQEEEIIKATLHTVGE